MVNRSHVYFRGVTAKNKSTLGILYVPSFCQIKPSQTSQTSQGRPYGQSIPAQPISVFFCKCYGRLRFHRLRCLRTENDFTGNVTVKNAAVCHKLPGKSQSSRCGQKIAWIRSVRPAQSLCLHHYLFFRSCYGHSMLNVRPPYIYFWFFFFFM